MTAKVSNYPADLTELEIQRFWSKVDKTGPWSLKKNSPGQCWIWTGQKNKKGYGHFSLRKKKVASHRVAKTLDYGIIPGDHDPDHLCMNTSCVNPYHMEVVPGYVNQKRGNSWSATNERKEYCPEGHPLEGENLRKDQLKIGKRACRSCNNARTKITDAIRFGRAPIDTELFKPIADEYCERYLGVLV